MNKLLGLVIEERLILLHIEEFARLLEALVYSLVRLGEIFNVVASAVYHVQMNRFMKLGFSRRTLLLQFILASREKRYPYILDLECCMSSAPLACLGYPFGNVPL